MSSLGFVLLIAWPTSFFTNNPEKWGGQSCVTASTKRRVRIKRKERERQRKTERKVMSDFTSTTLCNIYNCSYLKMWDDNLFFFFFFLLRVCAVHLCACWPGSSSTQWAPRRGEALFATVHSLLHLLLTFPVGQQACRSSLNYQQPQHTVTAPWQTARRISSLSAFRSFLSFFLQPPRRKRDFFFCVFWRKEKKKRLKWCSSGKGCKSH